MCSIIPENILQNKDFSEVLGYVTPSSSTHVGIYGRVHFHLPILDAQDPELSMRNAPSFREAHDDVGRVRAPLARPQRIVGGWSISSASSSSRSSMGSTSSLGMRSRKRGNHQLRSPSNSIVAGTSTSRTRVASM